MEENGTKLFRQKSLEKISSPDQLDKYVKTASPSVIILFVSVIVLLLGFLTWGIFGKVETKSAIGFIIENQNGSNITTSFVKESDYDQYIKDKNTDKMFMKFDDVEVEIVEISLTPNEVVAGASFSEDETFLFHAASINVGDRYYTVTGRTDFDGEGRKEGKIVFSTTNPISFLF